MDHPSQSDGPALKRCLGPVAGAVAAWALLLGYGGSMLACLVFFGSYLNHLIVVLGGHPVPLIGYLVGGLGCLCCAPDNG